MDHGSCSHAWQDCPSQLFRELDPPHDSNQLYLDLDRYSDLPQVVNITSMNHLLFLVLGETWEEMAKHSGETCCQLRI